MAQPQTTSLHCLFHSFTFSRAGASVEEADRCSGSILNKGDGGGERSALFPLDSWVSDVFSSSGVDYRNTAVDISCSGVMVVITVLLSAGLIAVLAITGRN